MPGLDQEDRADAGRLTGRRDGDAHDPAADHQHIGSRMKAARPGVEAAALDLVELFDPEAVAGDGEGRDGAWWQGDLDSRWLWLTSAGLERATDHASLEVAADV